MRIRIYFEKTDAMRFTGHLDLHKTWERTFRRSGMPLSYSQGFHPQPRLNLACALPLGFTSQAEILDAWLDNNFSIHEITTSLVNSSPPGIIIKEIEEAPQNFPALQTLVISADYEIKFKILIPDLPMRIVELLSSQNLPRVWRNKKYDLRPLVEKLELLPRNGNYPQRILTRLAARQGATGRPEELLAVLGIALNQARVHRIALVMQENLEG